MARLPYTWLYLLYYRAQYRWQANHEEEGRREKKEAVRNTTGGTEERKGEGETRLKRYNKSTSCVRHFLFAKQVINNRNKHTYEKPFRGYATKFSLNGEYNRTIISLYLQTYRRRYYERNNNFEYREACQETVFSYREREILNVSQRDIRDALAERSLIHYYSSY